MILLRKNGLNNDSNFRKYSFLYGLFFLSLLLIPGVSSGHDISKDSIKQNKTQAFYDSVYQKLSRHKFTQLLYGIAFVPPDNKTVTDSTPFILSESPFLPYAGKVIRNVRFLPLSPFGATVNDTGRNASTGIGRTLNKMHINTQKYIVREKLLFKQGDTLNPAILADNERSLRELSSFSDVKFFVKEAGVSGDSVDVIVVTKDVWSIGFDIPKLTNNNMTLRIFDANFLGLNDRFSNTFFFTLAHGPFLAYHGGSYNLSNIDGKFIDGEISYQLDEIGNEILSASVIRTFFANTIKWAGGGRVEYDHYVNFPEENRKEIAYYTNINGWIGRSFLLKKTLEPTRFILTEAVYWRDYSSRPFVSIDSNRLYYNFSQFLTGISFSRNNYYLTNYVLRFGKPENIPYGRLIQVVVGPELSDFYTRFYTGIKLGGGSLFKKFGYMSAFIDAGGYINRNNFEDAVIKGNLYYMSNLFLSKNKQFRFRLFAQMSYKMGFLFRNNNPDYSDLRNDLQYPGGDEEDSIFHGNHSWLSNLGCIMYTPINFYGFQFAWLLNVKAGLVGPSDRTLFRNRLYTGVGISMLIRNDNLIFANIVLSAFFYPNPMTGRVLFNGLVNEGSSMYIPNFNVAAPYTESLRN